MKFCVVKNDRQTVVHWERGIDRMNDLELLPLQNTVNTRDFYQMNN